MKITRLRVKPGQTLAIEAKNHPALRIALREGVKKLDDSSTGHALVAGSRARPRTSRSPEISRSIIIKIDFLTKPK